jgi:hypothetical protein
MYLKPVAENGYGHGTGRRIRHGVGEEKRYQEEDEGNGNCEQRLCLEIGFDNPN